MSTRISFTPNRGVPFVFGDLFQISSKLSHYTLGGIQQIVSVISGQYAEDKTRREETEQSEWFREDETSQEHESSKMESTHEGMQSALSETVSNSRSFGGAAAVEGSYGTVRASVSLSYDNDQSKTQSRSEAKDFAHDMVEQSRELVRQRTLTSRRESKTVTDIIEHTRGYDNRGGESSAFITRFVEEVHLFSLLQHRKHLHSKFTVPYPQANYLNAIEAGATTAQATPGAAPSDPGKLTYLDLATGQPVTITIADVTTDNSQPTGWVKLAWAVGLVEPTPPPEEQSQSVVFVVQPGQASGNVAVLTGSLKVPAGYRLRDVTVQGNAGTVGGWDNYAVAVFVGRFALTLKGYGPNQVWTPGPMATALHEELSSGDLPFSVYINGIGAGGYTLYARFTASDTLIEQWRLQFFEELRNAQSPPADSAVAGLIGVQVADLRSSPTAAKAMIEKELQRLAIQFVMGTDLVGLDAVDRHAKPFPSYPKLDTAKINQLQPILDFLYHGFDFEKMSYQFLPTYLGAPDERFRAYAGAAAGTGMLGEFLSAGAVEIVLPVRSGREEELFFFLQMGFLFSGSDVPLPDDPIMLALYDEILEARELAASDEPILIDSWELTLPTQLVILQEDARMPDWRDDGAVPGSVSGKALTPQQGS